MPRLALEAARIVGRPPMLRTASAGGRRPGPTNRTASHSGCERSRLSKSTLMSCCRRRRATLALIEGADLILIEIIFDTLNAKAALFAVRTPR